MSATTASQPAQSSRERVRAFLVTRSGDDLPAVLEAIRQQKRQPDDLTIVTVGRRIPAELLDIFRTDFSGRCQLVNLPEAANLGEAVKKALELAPDEHIPTWYWFLHDDSAPEEDALLELLRVGGRGGNIAVVGPKQVAWDDPNRLLELGIESTRSGRRIQLNSAVEIDQGQHDGRVDVLAVGTVGMLARTDIWLDLDGFDPKLGPFGDGLEYGRRARRAGYRVVAAPKAVIRHRQTSLDPGGDRRNSFAPRRYAQIYNWALAVTLPMCFAIVFGLAVWTPVRSLGRLLTRRSRLAEAEFIAYFAFLGSIPALVRARRRLARQSIQPRSTLTPLELSPRQLRVRRRLQRRMVRSRPRAVQRVDTATANLWRRGRRQERLVFGALILILALVSITLWYPYLPGVVGGNWSNPPRSQGTLWAQAWSLWVDGGVGTPGPGNPLLPLISVVAAPFSWVGISSLTVVKAFFVLALPLAGMVGWAMARTFTRSLAVRVGVAALWAAQPTFLAALGSGNLAGALLWIGLPIVVIGLMRSTSVSAPLRLAGVDDIAIFSRYDALTWGGVAGFGAILVGSAAPGLLLPIAAAAYLLAFSPQRHLSSSTRKLVDVQGDSWHEPGSRGHRPQRPAASLRLWSATLAWVPAALFVAPTWTAAIRGGDSARGVVEQLLNPQSLPVELPLGWEQILANATGTISGGVLGVLSVLAGYVLVLCGLLGLLTTLRPHVRRAGIIRMGALFGVLGWFLAGIQSGTGQVWTGAALGLSAIGWAVAAAASAGQITWFTATRPQTRSQRRRGRVHVALATLSIGAAVATVSTVWLIPGAAGMEKQEGTGSPAVAAEAAESPRRGRLLEIRQEDGSDELLVILRRGAGRQLEDLSWGLVHTNLETAEATERSLAEAVGTLAVRPSVLPAQVFADHAVELVLLPADTPTETGKPFANLNASEGFERIGTTEMGTMWRVRPHGELPSSAVVLGADSRQVIPAGAVGINEYLTINQSGTLLLAEPADLGWSATFKGQKLIPASDPQGWRQAFTIPAGTGKLTVSYEPRWSFTWHLATVLFSLVLLVTVIPWRPRRALWLREETVEESTPPTSEVSPDE